MPYLKKIRLDEMPPASSYLSRLPVVRFLSSVEALPLEKPVTFFVGENGTGKSTLLEAIAVCLGFNPEGGSLDHAFSTKDTHSDLSRFLSVGRAASPKDAFFLRAESFYNAASYLDETSPLRRYGGVSLHAQSHGEAFLSLIENRFEGDGLYLLDEPEAALSPQRLLTLLVAVDRLVKNRSQFVIATHSPILMAYPNADILAFSESGLRKTTLRQTQAFRITKQFLDDPDRMLHHLLKEDDTLG